MSASAASLPATPATAYAVPGALQQFFEKLESWSPDNRRNGGDFRSVRLRTVEKLRNLKAEIESKWHTACDEGCTSSSMLADILEEGWSEWKKIKDGLECA